MTFRVDPEVFAALVALAPEGGPPPPPPVGDVATRRTMVEALLAHSMGRVPASPDVETADHHTAADDGTPLLLRWYAKRGFAASGPGAAVLYVHGGGMILGNVGLYDPLVARYAHDADIGMLSVEYRYAPEHPGLTPVRDVFAGLRWLAANAERLRVDPARIAVMGDSAGGGIAAGLAQLTRDESGPPLAHQVLIYPMLDDRTVGPDPELARVATWTYDDNLTGWGALLGEQRGGPDVPCYAAPARIADPAGLAPAFIDVGELDIFRDECLEYARRLTLAGVSTELHLRAGVPHGFDTFAPESAVARRSSLDRIRVLRAL
ncbi:MAG TPA: alpha/beta hydrolase [Pseudonocardia sp.]